MKRLDSQQPGFDAALSELLAYEEAENLEVERIVSDILTDVRSQGDTAVISHTNRLDNRQTQTIEDLTISVSELKKIVETVNSEQYKALEVAAARIRAFHEKQKQSSWEYTDDTGTRLGQKVTPLSRVGVYVPGGKASYPSTALMNILPAKVAGVSEIIMVVPAPSGELNPLVLAAASIAGADRILTIGGAQAVAALAYGTESIPKVDKITGPGNIFVATAKQQVFGRVGLDMIAGPSEILIICDGKTDPEWIALDLFSQAEHDEMAQSILISPDADFLEAVEAAIKRLLPTLSRQTIIQQSLSDRGAMIKVSSLDEAAAISNRIAPEHLELSVENPDQLLEQITHAGAVFMGRYTSEALGDYCAGPNHVLPTAGTARFSSPLGVYDFQKKTSLIYCSEASASELGKTASVLARGESLEAHALSAERRIRNQP